MNPTKRLALESGGEVSLMTEAQLERLLRRLAILTRDPKVLSQYATPGILQQVSVSNAGQVKILNANKYRWGLWISCATVTASQIGFGNANLNNTFGIFIRPADPPMLITYNDIGAVILQPVWAFSSAINQTLNIQEFNVALPLDAGIGGWQR